MSDKQKQISGNVLVVAAEPSADRHAARLVRAAHERCPQLVFAGFGGEELREVGCLVHDDVTAVAAMGLGFLGNLRRYLRLVKRFDQLLVERRPRVVVLVDSPGLNFLLARLARWRGVPVAYYICPQIWAWAPWRLSKVVRWSDLLMVILPFEEALYAERGVKVSFVGHPLADEMAELPSSLGSDLRSRLSIRASEKVIGVFPGSRAAEVEKLMPYLSLLLKRMELEPSRHRVVVSCYRPQYRPLIEAAAGDLRVPLEILPDDARSAMMACDLALVASGTATLELAYLEKPMLVLYHTSRLESLFFRYFSVTPWIALPNVLSCGLGEEEPLVIEKLFCDDPTAELAPRARALLEEGPEREQAVRRLRRFKDDVLRPGGIERAAATLVSFLEGNGREGETPSEPPSAEASPSR